MRDFYETQLGNVVTFQRGFDITKKEQSPGNIPIISSSGIGSYHDQFKVEGPGVVIGRKGTLGTVHYCEGKFWPHDTSLWVKDFHGNNPKFIYYFLKTLKLENFDTGSSNPTLNRNHIHKIKILFPNKLIQNKIAALLSGYDDLIKINDQRMNHLEKIMAELYREWFVRFRFPDFRSEKFIKGIPSSWEIKPISTIVNFQSGFAFKSDYYIDNGTYQIVTIKNVHDGKFVTSCTDSIEEPPTRMPKYCILQNDDILMSLTGNVGRVCLFYGENKLLNQRVAKLVPLNSEHSNFIYWLFRQKSMMLLAEMISTGAAQQNLSPIKLGNQEILIPPSNLINQFQKIVTPFMENLQILNRQNEKLTNNRQLIISRLMSGKLSIKDLDIKEQ